jgi:hypothetical protein
MIKIMIWIYLGIFVVGVLAGMLLLGLLLTFLHLPD